MCKILTDYKLQDQSYKELDNVMWTEFTSPEPVKKCEKNLISQNQTNERKQYESNGIIWTFVL